MKKIVLISLIAVLALVLVGCGAVTQNISGRGTVQLFYGQLAGGTFVPGEATFSLNFACYAQNNNRLEGSLTWNDPTNGVRISATMPETYVGKFMDGAFTTCKQMKAAAAELGFSVNTAGVYSQNGNANGNAGTLIGGVLIEVTQPGGDLFIPYGFIPNPCGETGTAVLVVAETQQIPMYMAVGCLDRGKVVFGATQNQQ